MSDAATTGRSPERFAAAAPVVFVLLWSTGFVGAKYGLPFAPPFLLLAIRLLLSSVLLALLAAALRAPNIGGRQWGLSAVTGLLLHGGYLGGVFWAISRGFPAGISAVVVSLQPVLVAAAAAAGLLRERLRTLQWTGLVVGVLGVGLVVAPGLTDSDGFSTVGLLSCLVALGAGSAGTLHQKHYGHGIPLLRGTAVQYAAAGAVLAVLSLATEDLAVEWTPRFVATLAWMVLVLSLGAVSLLYALLRRGSASRVSSLFYLVPPITAVQAYLLFGETLAPVSLIGIVVSTLGVALVVAPRRDRADFPPE